MSSLIRRIQLGRNDAFGIKMGKELGGKPLRTDYSNSLPARGSRRKISKAETDASIFGGDK